MPHHRIVKIDELVSLFNLPEKQVARQLGVCLTSLKKICRQNGITRWPYRKLKSLDKKINKIETAMSNSAEDPSALIAKWEQLKAEKKALPFSASGGTFTGGHIPPHSSTSSRSRNHRAASSGHNSHSTDESDAETRGNRSSPVANAGLCSSALSSPATSVYDENQPITTRLVIKNNHHSSPSVRLVSSASSVASTAATPVAMNANKKRRISSTHHHHKSSRSPAESSVSSHSSWSTADTVLHKRRRADDDSSDSSDDEGEEEDDDEEEYVPPTHHMIHNTHHHIHHQQHNNHHNHHHHNSQQQQNQQQLLIQQQLAQHQQQLHQNQLINNELLACSAPSTPSSEPPRAAILHRPSELDLMPMFSSSSAELPSSSLHSSMIEEEASLLQDYYCRPDSARFSSRGTGLALDDCFRLPQISPHHLLINNNNNHHHQHQQHQQQGHHQPSVNNNASDDFFPLFADQLSAKVEFNCEDPDFFMLS